MCHVLHPLPLNMALFIPSSFFKLRQGKPLHKGRIKMFGTIQKGKMPQKNRGPKVGGGGMGYQAFLSIPNYRGTQFFQRKPILGNSRVKSI